MFSAYWGEFVSLGLLNLVALISPGPDFLITFKNSVFHSRKVGVYTALGISLGETVHITYILCGLGAIIQESLWILLAIKVLGSSYLIYIGWQSLKDKKMQIKIDENQEIKITPWRAVFTGFLTNALNPKAILFFLSVFMVVISPKTPMPVLLAYGAEMIIMTFVYFAIIAICFSNQRIVEFFHRFGKWIERITGGILISLGLKFAFTNLK